MVGTEKKNSTKFQIINYIINHKATSKVELSRNLNLSMPTVLSNVNELLASGIAVEMGEYESTGGRKAKMISINPAYRYAVGIRITAKHVGFVLVNLKSEIEKQALEKYISGNYELGKLNDKGQRISIRIEIARKDIGSKVSFITGWMVFPNGHIQLITPLGGK